MPSKSLWLRLIFTSAAVAIVLLVSAAFLLAFVFQTAVERNFDARLRAVIDGLLANVELGPMARPACPARWPTRASAFRCRAGTGR